MKSILSFLVILGLVGFGSSDDSGDCSLSIDSNTFDICAISGKTYVAPGPSSPSKDARDVTISIQTAQVTSCDGLTEVYGQAAVAGSLTADLTCADIATDAPTYALIDTDAPGSGFTITYPSFQNDLLVYQLNVIVECDADVADATFVFESSETSPQEQLNTITLRGKSASACQGDSASGTSADSSSPLYNFVSKYRALFIIVFLLIGLAFTFFGLRLFNLVIFVIAVLLTTFVVVSILYSFTSTSSSYGLLWGLFIISLIVGLGAGVLTLKYNKIGPALVGVALGVIAGLVFYAALISPFISSGKGSAVLIILVLIAAIVGGVIGTRHVDGIKIFATATIGAYITIRTLSLVIGGFAYEGEIANGERTFSAAVYAYLVAIGLLAAGGIFFQNKMKAKSDEQTETFK